MALGLARDSYIKLSSLSSAENESSDVSDVSYTIATAPRVGDSTVVALGVRGNDITERRNNDENSQSSGSKSSSSPKKESSYGAYSGFAMDYAEYDNNYIDPYAPTLLGNNGGTNKNFFCCLFPPWLAGRDRMVKPDDVSVPTPSPSFDSAPEDGDKTTAEDGDRATKENENGEEIIAEAVVDHPARNLARSASGDEDENSTGSDVLGDKLTDKERSAVLARLRLSQPDTPLMSDPPMPTGKGLLNDIPAEEPTLKGILRRTSMSKTSSFEEVQNTRTTAGKSKTPPGQRRSLFPVYHSKEEKKVDDRRIRFAPMARVVTVKSRKNMNIAEKSAIWWQKSDYEDFKKTGRLVAKAMLQGGSEVWLMTNKSWASPGTKKAVLGEKSDEAHDPSQDLDNKWWHKFGHSRRGLEHIASVEEGKQRQVNVRIAVRAVLDEQRKQRMYGRNDREKIRTVYLQYCSWARELAVAAGSSDHDAVSSNFSKARLSREFFLLKHRVKSDSSATNHVPDFMKPTGDGSMPNLDANTPSQIRMRRKIAQQTEAIHDPAPHSGKSIAKQAAGFGTADENVSMAAVLSGMGTVGANPSRASVGAH